MTLKQINNSSYKIIERKSGYFSLVMMQTKNSEPRIVTTGSEFDCMSVYIDIGVRSEVSQ